MSKYNYKVSVCVPVYNMEAYLEDCIESLVNQTLKDIELIFVNDESSDRSLAILERYAKMYKNIKIISQKNTGLGGARNSALAIAQGEFVGFVDADDFVDECMYENLYEAAWTAKADLVICDLRFYPDDNTKKSKWFTEFKGEVTAEFLNKNTQPWNKIVSNDLIKKINFRFFEKNGDGLYIILMLHANKILTIPNVLYNYRVGHASMSTNYKLENFAISIKSCEAQIELLKTTSYKESLKEYFEFRMIYVLLQALSIAALKNDENHFIEYSKRLKGLGYRNNKYSSRLLKSEFGKLKYFGMIYILPFSFNLSKLLTRIIL
jgi:glycosyltransferase involved in cell wall biosynthesis